jgi:alcohol dehydrogenase class IV
MRFAHPEFGLRQHIYQGAGCTTKLTEIIKREKWKRIILICGPTLYKSGAAKSIEESIRQSGAEMCVATEITPNPEAATIERELIPAALLFSADAIVAVGGGSTLDSAKGVAIVGDSGKRVMDFTIDKISTNERFTHNILPMVAIPTTAGTGSEVCKNAVISDESGYKLVLAHESILPKYAMLDPDFLKTLPFAVAVATTMDTFVQALETLTNRNANDFTQTQSLRSLELIGRSIRQFVANPADPAAANDMSLACMYAGFSLGLAGIGQVHVITHPMSEAPFFLSHGDACAMALPAVIEYNGFACKELYRRAYNALTGRYIPQNRFDVLYLIDWVVRLCDDLHVAESKSFAQWGFNEETLELMMRHPIVQFAVLHNMPAELTEYPRVTGLDDYRAIIRRVAAYSEEQAARAAMRKTRVW